jgi:DNA-binding GntR family transcriptional regulator
MWHEQIVNALRHGDAVGASAAMHLHLRQVREDLGRIDRAGGERSGLEEVDE